MQSLQEHTWNTGTRTEPGNLVITERSLDLQSKNHDRPRTKKEMKKQEQATF